MVCAPNRHGNAVVAVPRYVTCDDKNINRRGNRSTVCRLFPMKTVAETRPEKSPSQRKFLMLWDGSCTHGQDRSCTGHGDAFSETNREPQVGDTRKNPLCLWKIRGPATGRKSRRSCGKNRHVTSRLFLVFGGNRDGGRGKSERANYFSSKLSQSDAEAQS